MRFVRKKPTEHSQEGYRILEGCWEEIRALRDCLDSMLRDTPPERQPLETLERSVIMDTPDDGFYESFLVRAVPA